MAWSYIKPVVKGVLPLSMWELGKRVHFRTFGRPTKQGETSKARARRARAGFFDRYCRGRGLDVGWGGDLVCPGAVGWDYEDGDAQYLHALQDEQFDFVHASHILEHMVDPAEALRNWWRVLKPGGYLIVMIPDRETYEKKKTLPSRWNADHKTYFLLDRDDPPNTLGIVPLVERTLSPCRIVHAMECSDGHTIVDPGVHSDGEYSLEIVVRKPLRNRPTGFAITDERG